MTHQEMIDEVGRMLRNAKNTDYFAIWLNMAAKGLVAKVNIKDLHTIVTTPITTTSGQRTYALASDVFRPYNMWIPAIPRRIYPVDEASLANRDPKFAERVGPIYRYVLRGPNIDLWKVPDGTWLVYYSYFRAPAAITLGVTTEYTDIPALAHEYLIQRAITRGFMYDGNSSWAESQALEQKMFEGPNGIRRHLTTRPDYFHVLESEASIRVGHPVLPPDHFERVV